jgi:hypothetical protein
MAPVGKRGVFFTGLGELHSSSWPAISHRPHLPHEAECSSQKIRPRSPFKCQPDGIGLPTPPRLPPALPSALATPLDGMNSWQNRHFRADATTCSPHQGQGRRPTSATPSTSSAASWRLTVTEGRVPDVADCSVSLWAGVRLPGSGGWYQRPSSPSHHPGAGGASEWCHSPSTPRNLPPP